LGLSWQFRCNIKVSTIEEVSVNTLDNVLSKLNIKGVDLLKIDTEESELYMLKGAKRTCIDQLSLALDRIKEFLIKGHTSIPEKIVNLYYLDGYKDYITYPVNRKLYCYADFISFFLDPYGNIFPCRN